MNLHVGPEGVGLCKYNKIGNIRDGDWKIDVVEIFANKCPLYKPTPREERYQEYLLRAEDAKVRSGQGDGV